MERETPAAQSARLAREYREFLAGPEFQSALKQDGENRELAFLDYPEIVAGIPLRPMTALDLLVHCQCDTPLLSISFISGRRTAADAIPFGADDLWFDSHVLIPPPAIGIFLWMQSTVFLPQFGSRWQRFRARRRYRAFIRRCRRLKYGEAVEAIRRYLDDALCDRPGGSSSGGQPSASWISADVHCLASRFHWNERDILNLPLKRLFQYERRIIESAGERAALFNRADKLKGDWLAKVNEQLKSQRKEQQ